MKLKIVFLIIFAINLSFSQVEKSKGKALVLSMIYPGAGEFYLSEYKNINSHLIIEAGLITSYFGVRNYGYELMNDSKIFANINSSAKLNKDDLYYSRIGNYNSIYEYNEQMLREQNLTSLYEPINDFYWYWQNNGLRNEYHDLRIKADNIVENSSFIIAGMVLNRIISVIKILNYKPNKIENNWNIYFRNKNQNYFKNNISLEIKRTF